MVACVSAFFVVVSAFFVVVFSFVSVVFLVVVSAYCLVSDTVSLTLYDGTGIEIVLDEFDVVTSVDASATWMWLSSIVLPLNITVKTIINTAVTAATDFL